MYSDPGDEDEKGAAAHINPKFKNDTPRASTLGRWGPVPTWAQARSLR